LAVIAANSDGAATRRWIVAALLSLTAYLAASAIVFGGRYAYSALMERCCTHYRSIQLEHPIQGLAYGFIVGLVWWLAWQTHRNRVLRQPQGRLDVIAWAAPMALFVLSLAWAWLQFDNRID
jgi:hypothetical protein